MGKSTSEGSLPQIEAAAPTWPHSCSFQCLLLPKSQKVQTKNCSGTKSHGPCSFWGISLREAAPQPAPALQAGWHSSTPSCSFIYLSTKSLILLQLQCRGRPQSEQNPAVMGCSHPTFPGADSGTEVTGGCRAAHGCC